MPKREVCFPTREALAVDDCGWGDDRTPKAVARFGFTPTARELNAFMRRLLIKAPALERVELAFAGDADAEPVLPWAVALARGNPHLNVLVAVDHGFALRCSAAALTLASRNFGVGVWSDYGYETLMGIAIWHDRAARLGLIPFLHLVDDSPHSRFLRRDGDNRVARRVLDFLVRMTL